MTDKEINEAVARKLGWPLGQKYVHPKFGLIEDAPDYCHSVEAAWEIVDRLKSKGIGVDVACGHPHSAFMTSPGYRSTIVLELGEWVWATAETASEAICKAFLKLGNQ